jgi:predicted GIY-YIG superfamily endonuclease
MRRINVSLRRQYAMHVTRVALKDEKLVYVIVANKKLRYPGGRSRIAYIGTTKNGKSRVAQSAAYRTDQILRLHGVDEFDVRIVACRRRQNVKTWLKLERAMLIAFREQFGTPPICNSHGKRMLARDEFNYFTRSRINTIIEDLS